MLSMFIVEYLVCCLVILILAERWGKAGLYTYMALAAICANIQVIKTVNFEWFDFPIALGTIVFSSTFLCSDIIAEFFGKDSAIGATWVSLLSTLFVTIIMYITISLPPASDSVTVQSALECIFSPSIQIFSASLMSYIVSQYIDINIFQKIRTATNGKYLWLRSVVSLSLSALIDNIVFSTLAWVIFSKTPVDLHTLIYTYILSTYVFRLGTAILETPMMYIMRAILRPENAQQVNVQPNDQ